MPGEAESELFCTDAPGIMDIFLSLFVFVCNDYFCQRLYRLQQNWTIQNTNTSDGWFHWSRCQTERWTTVRQNLMTFQKGIPECETITVCCGMKCSQGAAGYFILKKNKPSERDSNSHCCFHPPAQSDQAALWRIL